MSLSRPSRAWLVVVAGLLAGCDDPCPMDSRGLPPNLLDPAVRPHVVSTYPQDGGIGPFNLYAPGNETQPHFVLQFDKLIEPYRFASNWLRMEGFEPPVQFELVSSGSNWRQLTDVLAVRVQATETRSSKIYEVGRTYAVTVDTTLRDVTGNHPVAPYRFSFVPEPFFRVIRVDFERGQPVWPHALVRIQFNAAVDAAIDSSLQFEPAVSGSWVHPAASVVFNHQQPFAFGTTYTLRVSDTATDAQGNHLREPFTTTFQVRTFEIDRTYPGDGSTMVSPQLYISVMTTGLVDTTTVPQAFTIEPATPGRFAWGGLGFTFLPDEELQPSTRYQVGISTALGAWDGTRLAAPYSFSFTTDQFRVVQTQPYDGAFEVPVDTPVAVHFSLQIDPTTVEAAFTISPAVSGTFETPDGRSFEFAPSAPLAPATFYTVTISTALRARNGAALLWPYTFSFTTASP